MINAPIEYYLRRVLLPAIVIFFAITACQSYDKDQQAASSPTEEIQFEHRVQAEYAEGFRITYHENYKLLEILNPFQNRVDTLRYALIPRAASGQVDVPGATEIVIPLQSLIVTSTTHVALTDVLGANNIIEGVVGGEYVYNEEVKNSLDNNEIVSFSEGEFNKEQALAMNPDLIMISGGQSSQFDDYRILIKSGINILVNSEWLETTPLGKAEWIKVMAALLDREERANEHFNIVKKRYKELKSEVQKANEKPDVLINLPFKGAWFVPGGNSYTAQLLKDAGADYPWSDSEETGGLRKSFEVVYKVGLDADVWLNPGSATSKNEILTKDSRFRDFKSFQTGKIYNHYKRTNSSGGNDFWESGVVYPEIVLADLIKILHPSIVPDHSLYYYHKVE